MTSYNNIRGIKAFGHLLSKMLPVDCFRFILRICHGILALIEMTLSWYAFWRYNNRGGSLSVFEKTIIIDFLFKLDVKTYDKL